MWSAIQNIWTMESLFEILKFNTTVCGRDEVWVDVPKCSASGAVHLMGICLSPPDTVYSSSSRDIPKSEIFTTWFFPTRQLRAARSL